MASIIHEAECVVNISGPLAGTFYDWPANIQDGIWKALEKHSVAMQAKYTQKLTFELKMARVDYDEDHGWYIHAIALVKAPMQ